jgi:hypothetical protein
LFRSWRQQHVVKLQQSVGLWRSGFGDFENGINCLFGFIKGDVTDSKRLNKKTLKKDELLVVKRLSTRNKLLENSVISSKVTTGQTT